MRWSCNQSPASLLPVKGVKTKPCVVYMQGAATSYNTVSRFVTSPDNLLKTVAAVGAILSQVTGPLSLQPVVTGALLAQVSMVIVFSRIKEPFS